MFIPVQRREAVAAAATMFIAAAAKACFGMCGVLVLGRETLPPAAAAASKKARVEGCGAYGGVLLMKRVQHLGSCNQWVGKGQQ